MSILQNKSELNFVAAEMLHEKSMYNSVVHCAYYSCFQLMKHIWLKKMGKTEDELSALTRNSADGSHEVLINQLNVYLKGKSLDSRSFNTTIVSLKKLRTKADYQEVGIDSDHSKKSITLSKETSIVLKKCL